MIVNVISLVIQNIISKNQSLKGCPKKIPDSRTKPQIGNVHESGNEKIKIRKTTTPKEKKKMNLRKVEQEME